MASFFKTLVCLLGVSLASPTFAGDFCKFDNCLSVDGQSGALILTADRILPHSQKPIVVVLGDQEVDGLNVSQRLLGFSRKTFITLPKSSVDALMQVGDIVVEHDRGSLKYSLTDDDKSLIKSLSSSQ